MAIKCSGRICYWSGYEFQLNETAWVQTDILGQTVIVPGFVSLTPDGVLTIYKSYAWDGATDAIKDGTDMRGSLYHDALYQLLRETDLDEKYKANADRLYRAVCIEDGMPTWRADIQYEAIKRFGTKASEKKQREKFYAGKC